jgi:hypothetical protein
MSYRVLVLDSNARKMSLPVLRKISALVKAGATICGVRPESLPGLGDDKSVFESLVNETWNPGNPKVITNRSIQDVLAELKVAPDFTYNKPGSNTKLLYVHRSLPGADIYWVNNRNDKTEVLEAVFLVTGKVPQLWHPETGKTGPVSYRIENGVTRVDLRLQPYDAVFVVFNSSATKTAFTLPATTEKELATLEGSWNVSFLPGRGAPAHAAFDQLTSWTENANTGIKYFSGTATYTKTIDAPAGWFGNQSRIFIDLGDVKNMAEVIVNGKSLGLLWKKPFVVDVTDALKPGVNKLEIKVTNLWVNRLIGDLQPGVENKVTFTTMPFYQASSPLLTSGLLGPVRVLARK